MDCHKGYDLIFDKMEEAILPLKKTDYLEWVNLTGLTTCIIGRNGEKIMNASTDLTVDKVNVGFMMRYTGASLGWILI